ncbi:nucleoside diphosphate kinase [Ceratobasidium sp. AG-Ba]|nr:nucleoside diphosphate kinase [Ceratobasidium sp. AG-Ba]QRW06439.1 nucleoside diphosphate kinase [Ceratobasidium sp. AG-Ba]
MSQNGNTKERSCIMVKPDGIQRGLVGEIISRFEKRGYKIIAAKMVYIEDEKERRERFEKHYAGFEYLEFFDSLIEYLKCGPVLAMVIEGTAAIRTGRAILGETDPPEEKSGRYPPGTIRGDYALSKARNVCHGSSSAEEAEKEIALWFPEGFYDYTLAVNDWIYS